MPDYAFNQSNTQTEPKDAWEDALIRKVQGYTAMADLGESARRRSDRIGARLLYGQHWGVSMPNDRAAITANIAMSLIMHKMSIMTKQEPVPVVEPDDVGDAESARIMRQLLMKLWDADRMQFKLRRGLLLANTTRTCAGYVLWDPTLRGGNGDITTDVIPGWRMIIDNRANEPERMQYCGHRAEMTRARAMRLYPEAATDIEEASAPGGGGKRTMAGTSASSNPTGTPWATASAPNPGATTINGQPVITAFAGDVGFGVPSNDQVEIIEMYHRDLSMYKTTEKVRDHIGSVKRKIKRGEDGMPLFEQLPDEMQFMPELGKHIPMPSFKLSMEEVEEEVRKPKYPHWRRTTYLSPGAVMLDDIPWDGPLPYIFFNDTIALDGMITRGSMLQIHHLQGLLNVGLSVMTDNLRMGSIKAWLAGSQSGLATQQLIPGVGQVIPVNDPNQIRALDTPGLDQNWFQMISQTINLMERIVGAEGIMQGEAQGRVDSSSAYDTLAEIGSSRIVEATQRMESALADWARICGWFAQKYYTQKHSIAVEDDEGNVTWERAFGPLLAGTFSFNVETGSTLAFSESAIRARLLQEYQLGLIDRQEYYIRTNTPNWRQMMRRLATTNPVLSGPAASPPPRTRSSVKPPSAQPPPGQMAHA